MNKVQENLLQILSDVLWKKTTDHRFSEMEWEELLTLAEDQGVLFLILQGCSSIRCQMSSANWSKWRSKLVSTIVNNESLVMTQSRIIRWMEDNGIPCAILKGTSLSACYCDPLTRALGDIDLLVAPQYAKQAVQILLEQGFSAPKESFEHPYHIDFYKNGMVVELHFAVSTFPDSAAGTEARRYMETCWQGIQQRQIGDYTFPCLSDAHQALSLVLHMERHMTTGCIGLRQLCDWAVFVRSVSPDYFAGQIVPKLKSCGLEDFADVLTETSVRYLGLDSNHTAWSRPVSDGMIQAMMEEILRVGSIHNKNNTDDSSSIFVEISGTESVISVFVKKINAIAGRKFPITQRVPLLLPVFWVYIPVRYWIRSLLGKRKRKSLMRTIGMTKQRKKLYRELGLFKTEK